ncbi:hypothetical protein BJF79_37605 [Actinomadura sp. CNU-125]|uniref:hypothetical protein n=1 Tax=Actinomadura sp. CNU-125 TaxID=1904961 RepID=UPI00096164E4|nr:hypothetical protein [Actinomadura sp. CNU-125]OLT31088.1 hypothetical protein BJF79_37605 [Actinomadura sp. CNU-125]
MRTITMLLTVGALLAAAPAAAAAPPPEPRPTIEYGAPDGTGNGGLVDFDDEVVDASDLGKLTLVVK